MKLYTNNYLAEIISSVTSYFLSISERYIYASTFNYVFFKVHTISMGHIVYIKRQNQGVRRKISCDLFRQNFNFLDNWTI